ncbi:MAG: endolytic transglycosylase MltG [Solirubrobacterales bacterium]|nr:endolytic transglycosylase MltG [Solirubrobacterales bacterium]HRV60785.1 endolytic transglycosylase MltG [Solirubrobacterales bacterium]
MSDRWFDDLPEHDPNDPDAVERALRRQERASRRQQEGSGKQARKPVLGSGRSGGSRGSGGGRGSRGDRRRVGSGGPRTGRIVAVAVGAVGLIIVVWFLFALFQPFKGDGDGEPFPLNVPAGDSVGQIGDLLADRGIISNSTLFELRATLSGKRGDLNHGVHQFRENMSYSSAIDELTKTTSKRTITVTIPEGLSRSETAAVVKEAGIPGDYMAATVKVKGFNPNDYGAQGRAENLEGFLFPATYELKPTADVEDLVAEQLQAFKDNIAGVNMKYAKSKNLTVYDVLTIASMIEREVSVAKERKLVSAVIYNRLKMGEPLGIDATIRFALDNWTDPLTETDLATDSPYNTRTNQGLPPGPIGNPGLASIEAAAHPADSKVWLYVVKPGTCGEHVFSSSLAEHNRNVEKYQEAQAAAGGSPTDCG